MKQQSLKKLVKEVMVEYALELNELSATSSGGASFEPGKGEQYATPAAFTKGKGENKGTKYLRKLGYKKAETKKQTV